MKAVELSAVLAMSLVVCGCSSQKGVNTSSFFSETEWEQSQAQDKSVLELKPTEKRYQIFRRGFLNAQLAKALFVRNVQKTPALDLPDVEQKALRELIELDRCLATVPDNSEIDLSKMQVEIEKRHDGQINLIIVTSGSRHIRSTTATWVTTAK